MFSDARILYAAGVALLAAAAIFVGVHMSTQHESFRKLPLAYKLTQSKAGLMTPAQILGAEPLMRADTADEGGAAFEPPTMHDLRLSMLEDLHRRNFSGICALNYNIPLSMCLVARIGEHKDVWMYNLWPRGVYTDDFRVAQETSLLCDRGEVAYGPERFDAMWIGYLNEHGRQVLFFSDGAVSRVLQHMMWLNNGYRVCDSLPAAKQMQLIFEMNRPV